MVRHGSVAVTGHVLMLAHDASRTVMLAHDAL